MNDIRWCGVDSICPRTTNYHMFIKNGDKNTEIKVEIIKENEEWLDAIRKDTGEPVKLYKCNEFKICTL